MANNTGILDPDFFSGDEMQALRHSLYFKTDKYTEFRELVLDYINTSTYNPQDSFFFDMIPAIRFLYNDHEHVAYTTQEKLVWLNVPYEYKKVEWWDFIYYHECLHQLWSTFEVGDKIKKSGVKLNFRWLNLASDCIINDFLATLRKKEMPPNLITPEYIKKNFGVEYDRYTDDQLTLYMKMVESGKHPSDEQIDKDMGDGDVGEGGEERGEDQSGQGDDTGQNAPNGQGNDGDEGGENGGDDEGQSGKGDGEALEMDPTKAPRKGAFSSGKLDRSKGVDRGFSYDPKYEKLSQSYINDIVSQYSNNLTGPLGNFVNKCKSAIGNIGKLKAVNNTGAGITFKTNSQGTRDWNKRFNAVIDREVGRQVNKASSKFKKTYSRPKRGAGVTKIGGPLIQGKQRIKDGVTISIAYYVDTSGSMEGQPISNVCRAVNTLTVNIDKKYMKKDVVKNTEFTAYSFDERFRKEQVPLNIPARNAGNIDLDELLIGMQEKTDTCWVNVIFTDAGFTVIPRVCIPIIKKFKGIIVFVINSDMREVEYKQIEKACSNFIYIQADDNFSI